jgi:hypothetical protein
MKAMKNISPSFSKKVLKAVLWNDRI